MRDQLHWSSFKEANATAAVTRSYPDGDSINNRSAVKSCRLCGLNLEYFQVLKRSKELLSDEFGRLLLDT